MRERPVYRRARRGWYSVLERKPAAYCAYRRRRQPASPVVTQSTDVVIEARPPFPHDDPSAVEQVFETLAAYDRSLGLADGRSAIPGRGRSERNARARSRLEEPRYGRLVRRSRDVYARFAALEATPSAPVGAG